MRAIEFEINVIVSVEDQRVFFDAIFDGDVDVLTDGLVCFARKSEPFHLIIAEMNKMELAISDYTVGFQEMRKRIIAITGYDDLTLIENIGFEKLTNKDLYGGYKKTIIYRSIFDPKVRSYGICSISVDNFRNLGGIIELVDDLYLSEIRDEKML